MYFKTVLAINCLKDCLKDWCVYTYCHSIMENDSLLTLYDFIVDYV